MPTMARTLRRRTLCLAAASTALCNVATAAQPEKKEEHLFISEQFVYDDNLFRAPETSDPDAIPGDPGAPDATTRGLSREDYSNRITLGLGDDMQFGRQTLKLRGRVHDVRFDENDYLDHTAGDASALFDFRLLGSWSGRLSGTYNRALADFANTLGTTKDLIETANYNAALRYEIGPRWSLSANGGRIETRHALATRRQQNLEADLGRVSLDYVTPSFHSFGVEYRYLDARFPNAVPDPGSFSSDYEENGALARFTYTATVRTQIRLSGGYVERERPDTDEGSYSGDVWRAEIDWKPREKFSTLFAAWRELRAYTDIESDYFVSDGFSLAPTWSPVEKITLAFSVSYEDQEYLTSRVLDLNATNAPRNDEVLSAFASFTYRPRDHLAFELSYRGSDRDSNRINRRYDAQTAGISIRWSVL